MRTVRPIPVARMGLDRARTHRNSAVGSVMARKPPVKFVLPSVDVATLTPPNSKNIKGSSPSI
jgi:hypothetical protein